ncbi:ribonuclease III [Wohlfahrtiimonas chitiniclastica]|uniref:Ribonuclease 3 n=2 Tax=Wohlfahrtiimonas chitiniclastica TaxID=400946 RepID=L8Y1D1_9GAMM|nr:ribonuclease III [Wohlfahrtiimonas chitiniclastica]ELV08780.1 Ribonuclease 3 [Wohlfahrtiimonas chitiniclastica SH04]KZS22443.1 ribonuclease III [Wohlfahrtiimonas chitiniclastica]KZX37966.1 ribonuclease 3 [Wohlfahrtiimonas chitiniclastica]MBS7816224.1 ribonuclease III [Wohlfahrtiimonas chitiniclastica]MBS7817857.1 ribonuclease III [Wohlfahrtiimonas chitiniclastica]
MIDRLQEKLGYQFTNIALLKQALVHRSVSRVHNERLEFLGDGCLNFTIAHALYERFPDAKEGELSNIRAHLVKEETLHTIAKSLDLQKHLVISYGERKNDGAKRASILADTVEAIIAAVFLDSNFESAKAMILRLYEAELHTINERSFQCITESVKDPKSRLQEHLQAINKSIPEYEIVAIEGQDHAQSFKVACHAQSFTTIAEGTSKKRAEQNAAQLMLDKLL